AYPSLKGAVESNRVKLIATNGAQRSPLAPDVPSLAEVIPGFDLITLIGVYARTGTPSPIVDKIAAEAVAIVKQPAAGFRSSPRWAWSRRARDRRNSGARLPPRSSG